MFTKQYGKLNIIYGILIPSFQICYELPRIQCTFANLYPKLTVTLLTLYLVPWMDQTGPCPFHRCRTVSFYCSPQHTREIKDKTKLKSHCEFQSRNGLQALLSREFPNAEYACSVHPQNPKKPKDAVLNLKYIDILPELLTSVQNYKHLFIDRKNKARCSERL